VHAENGDVIEVTVKEALAEGHTAPKYHALTRPVELEREATSRAIRLAEVAGAPLYVVHVSSAMAADAISDGRKRGLPIYGETCPQYLVCDVERLRPAGFRRRELRDVAAAAREVESSRAARQAQERRAADLRFGPLLVQQLRAEGTRPRRLLEDPQRRADDRRPRRDPVRARRQRAA
jgi:dihydroorotase-like cyclic amidohydrolase